MDFQVEIPAKRPKVWPVDIVELMYDKTQIPVRDKALQNDVFTTSYHAAMKNEVPSDEDTPQVVQDLGPYTIVDLGKRQLAAFNSGFLTDVTIIVEDQAIKCHSNILSFASPKLAAILKEKKPRLYDIDRRQFRLLLKVIYSGETFEPQDVGTLLRLGHLAVKLEVPAVVRFSALNLAMTVDTQNLWRILDFAILISDAYLQEACLETIRQNSGSILRTDGFLQCDLATLESILMQNTLCNVTELQLFQACVAWTKAKPSEVQSRRAAVGSVLHLVRFRLFSAKDFATHVCPTGLLDMEIERNIFRSCTTGASFMPERFSASTTPRDTSHVMEIGFASTGERRGYNHFLQNFRTSLISVDENILVTGVKLRAWRQHIRDGYPYEENVSICLQGNAFSRDNLEVARFRGQVKKGDMISLIFERPYEMSRFTNHALHVGYSQFNDKNHVYELYQKATLKSKTGLQLCVLSDFLAPPDLHLIIAVPG